MPQRPNHPCTFRGCGKLTRNLGGRCDEHPKEQWVKRPDAPKRVTGRRLQQMREALFRAHPLCVDCQAAGRVTLATERDHKVPLAEGGTDDPDNVQGLCADCHREKSQAEAVRGSGRAVRTRRS